MEENAERTLIGILNGADWQHGPEQCGAGPCGCRLLQMLQLAGVGGEHRGRDCSELVTDIPVLLEKGAGIEQGVTEGLANAEPEGIPGFRHERHEHETEKRHE